MALRERPITRSSFSATRRQPWRRIERSCRCKERRDTRGKTFFLNVRLLLLPAGNVPGHGLIFKATAADPSALPLLPFVFVEPQAEKAREVWSGRILFLYIFSFVKMTENCRQAFFYSTFHKTAPLSLAAFILFFIITYWEREYFAHKIFCSCE